MTALSDRFRDAMVRLCVRTKRETGYNATYFLRMVEEQGAEPAAHQLINSAKESTGFTALWERGRLDLSVEALALDPQYASLFTADELDKAADRLRQYGYKPKAL